MYIHRGLTRRAPISHSLLLLISYDKYKISRQHKLLLRNFIHPRNKSSGLRLNIFSCLVESYPLLRWSFALLVVGAFPSVTLPLRIYLHRQSVYLFSSLQLQKIAQRAVELCILSPYLPRSYSASIYNPQSSWQDIVAVVGTQNYASETRSLDSLACHIVHAITPWRCANYSNFTTIPSCPSGCQVEANGHCLTHIIHNSFTSIYGHDYGMRTAINNEIVRGKLAGNR